VRGREKLERQRTNFEYTVAQKVGQTTRAMETAKLYACDD